MPLKDALVVTFLGMGVVYVGLIMTSLMLYALSFLPRIIGLFAKKPELESATPPPPAAAASTSPSPKVDPAVIAVIATVLEAEFQKMALLEGRFTFK